MDWQTILTGLGAASIPSGLTLVGVWLTGKKQKETKQIEAHGPNWQAFTDAVTEQNEKTKQELRQQNEDTKRELTGKIDRLQGKVARLEDGLKSVSAKYHKSLIQLVAWHRRHPDDPLVDSVPEELAHDMQYNYLSWQYPSDDGDAT